MRRTFLILTLIALVGLALADACTALLNATATNGIPPIGSQDWIWYSGEAGLASECLAAAFGAVYLFLAERALGQHLTGTGFVVDAGPRSRST